MARKNIQDDGSYQKSQKLGNSKGKFDKKEEELEPPIKASMYAYRLDNISDDKGIFVGDAEENGLDIYGKQEQRLGYMPLDANGRPAPGMVPFEGDAADMLSKENKKAAINRQIERSPMSSEKGLDPWDENEKKFGKFYRRTKWRLDDGLPPISTRMGRNRNKAIKDELKKLEEKKEKK